MTVCRRGLAVVERTLVEVRLADGWTIRAIARALDRSPGMVSDEVARRGGTACYAAQAARAQAACARSRCRRKPRLGAEDALFAEAADLLRSGWSPERIAGRRTRIEDGVEQQADRAISHEATGAAIYALPRGEPRRELIACLRQGLRPRAQAPVHELGGSELCCKLCDMTPIAERPADVAARLVPGHREGDLVLGQANSAIGTLVERTTRLLLLVLMPTHKADVAASAFAGALNAIPAPLRRTLTYDQGTVPACDSAPVLPAAPVLATSHGMMIRPIRTEQDLADARADIARLIALDPAAGSDEFDRLDVLVTLAESYEARHRDGPPADPVDAIWEKMGETGISQRLLAAITRIPEPELADVLARRRALGAAMMGVLGPALGLPLDVLMRPARTGAART